MKSLIIILVLSLVSFSFAADCDFEVVTPWTGTGVNGDANRPLIGDVFNLKQWEDVTGQPSVNIPTIGYIIKGLSLCSVVNDIKLDSRFYVLWSQKVLAEGEVAEPEFELSEATKLMIKDKLKGLGISDEIATMNGSKKDHAEKLKEWLKDRPKVGG